VCIFPWSFQCIKIYLHSVPSPCLSAGVSSLFILALQPICLVCSRACERNNLCSSLQPIFWSLVSDQLSEFSLVSLVKDYTFAVEEDLRQFNLGLASGLRRAQNRTAWRTLTGTATSPTSSDWLIDDGMCHCFSQDEFSRDDRPWVTQELWRHITANITEIKLQYEEESDCRRYQIRGKWFIV